MSELEIRDATFAGRQDNLNTLLQRLRDGLVRATAIYENGGHGGRDGAVEAVGVVVLFLRSIEELSGLAVPLAGLGLALGDLKVGSVHPMLKPSNFGKIDSSDRRLLIGVAAFLAHGLINSGESPGSARRAIAKAMNQAGVRRERGQQISEETIRTWQRRATSETQPMSREAQCFRGLRALDHVDWVDLRKAISVGTGALDRHLSRVLTVLIDKAPSGGV